MSLRLRDRDLTLMASATFTYALAYGLYYQLLYVYALQLGASRFLLGILNAITLICMTLGMIPGAWAATRFPVRKVIIAIWWLTVPAALCFMLAPNWQWMIPGMMLAGFYTANSPAMKVYIVRKSHPSQIAANITRVFGAQPAGMIVAPLVGGLLADRFGMRVVFAISAGLFAISSTIVTFLRDVPQPAERERLDLRAALHNWAFFRYLSFFLVAFMAVYMCQAFVNPYLAQVHDQGYGALGVFAALTAFGAAVLSPASGHLADRRGPRAGVGLVVVCLGLAGPLLVFGPGYAVWGLAALCFGGCDAVRYVAYGVASRSFGDLPLVWGYGLFDFFTGIPMTTGALLGGVLYRESYSLPFLAVAGLCAVLLIVLGTATLRPRVRNKATAS